VHRPLVAYNSCGVHIPASRHAAYFIATSHPEDGL
jgi:hypothetical protein